MSSYIAKTKHPITGKWKNVFWIDDYFGRHHYGVIFVNGKLYWPKALCAEYQEIFDPEKIKIKTK